MFSVDLLLQNTREIEHLKHMIANMVRAGSVCDVDPIKGYRLDWGEDGKGGRYKSPWMPAPESGGNTKTWMPLSVGQIMYQINPVGDPQQGVLLRGGFSDQHGSPSENLEENVFVCGDVRISIRHDELLLKIGEVEFHLSSKGFRQNGGDIHHDEISIGNTHRHKDVANGKAISGIVVNG